MLPVKFPHRLRSDAFQTFFRAEDRMIVIQVRECRHQGLYVDQYFGIVVLPVHLLENNFPLAMKILVRQSRKQNQRMMQFKPLFKMLRRQPELVGGHVVRGFRVVIRTKYEKRFSVLLDRVKLVPVEHHVFQKMSETPLTALFINRPDPHPCIEFDDRILRYALKNDRQSVRENFDTAGG